LRARDFNHRQELRRFDPEEAKQKRTHESVRVRKERRSDLMANARHRRDMPDGVVRDALQTASNALGVVAGNQGTAALEAGAGGTTGTKELVPSKAQMRQRWVQGSEGQWFSTLRAIAVDDEEEDMDGMTGGVAGYAQRRHLAELEDKCKLVMPGHGDADVKDGLRFIVRALASTDVYGIIEDIIHYNVLPRLVVYMERTDDKEIMYQAIMSVTTIACGQPHQVAELRRQGVMAPLVRLMTSSEQTHRAQALFAISNMSSLASPNGEHLEELLELGIVTPMLWLLGKALIPDCIAPPAPSLSNMRHLAWICNNILSSPHKPTLSVTSSITRILGELIFSPDLELVAESLTAFSTICSHGTQYIQLVLERGPLQRITQLYDESMMAKHVEGVDVSKVDISHRPATSQPNHQGVGHSSVHGNQGVTQNNRSRLIIRAATVRLISALSRSRDRVHCLVLLQPSLQLVHILVEEVDLHTDLPTSIEACQGVANAVLSAAASDSGFTNSLVRTILTDLSAPDIVYKLDAAMSHNLHDLWTAAMDPLLAMLRAVPANILNPLCMRLGLKHMTSLFALAQAESAALDLTLIMNALSAVGPTITAALALGSAILASMSWNLTADLENLGETLQGLEAHPNDDISRNVLVLTAHIASLLT